MMVLSKISLVVMSVMLLLVFGTLMAYRRDAASMKWSHATNSKKKLLEALESDALNFIEADILMGRTESGLQNVPIMAHPPDTSSDISFAEWIGIARRGKTSKVLKLDFKDIDSLEPCLRILQETRSESDHEIWLNADILEGPGSPPKSPVDRARFLTSTRASPLKHTLSIGWTTGSEPGHYSWKNVLDMLSVIEDIPESTPITFPVRMSKLSFHPLALLISLERNTSLTVWSSETDTVSYEEVIRLLKTVRGKIFLDLPSVQATELDRELAVSKAVPPARISVVRSEIKIQAYPYSVITEDAGEITLRSEKPATFHYHRIDGDVEASESREGTASNPTHRITFTLAGKGRMAIYAEAPELNPDRL